MTAFSTEEEIAALEGNRQLVRLRARIEKEIRGLESERNEHKRHLRSELYAEHEKQRCREQIAAFDPVIRRLSALLTDEEPECPRTEEETKDGK